MPEGESAHIQGRHVSQPLVAEYDTLDDIDEPVAIGAWRPVVSPAQAVGDKANNRIDKYSRNSADYSKKASKWTSTRVVALCLAALLLGVLGFAGFQIYKANYKEAVNAELRPESVEDAEAAREVLTPTTARDPFYMMIIGTDSRYDDEGERSDTNIVARVDPQAGSISMISIPRDTAIMLEGHGIQKFNAAYSFGGIPGVIQAAESLLGVKISHYALVDFDGMISLVDAIGGVDVDVPVYIDDPDAGPVTVDAGLQHLDGEHALVFARSRAYITGDFQRTTNQRTLISAMLNQCMTLSNTDLPRVIESAAECMTTDLTVTMLHDYALYFMNFEEIVVYSVMVPSGTAMSEGSSYVVCDTATLLQVMQAINAGKDPSGYVADYTVTNSEEAQAAGMADAIGIDSRLLEGGYVEDGYIDDGTGYADGFY